MKQSSILRTLDLVVGVMVGYAVFLDGIQLALWTSKLLGNAWLLNLLEGFGLFLALTMLGLVFAAVAIAVYAAVIGFAVRQAVARDWAWLCASVVAGLCVPWLSMTAVVAVSVAYYAFVLRPKLSGGRATGTDRAWQGIAIAQAVLAIAALATSIPFNGGTRALVTKPAPGEEAPFSLETHALPVPHDRPAGGYIRSLTVSPDGTRAAFLIDLRDNVYLVVDELFFDIPSDWYSYLDLVFTEDSEQLLFIAYNNRNLMASSVSSSKEQEASFVGIKDRGTNELRGTTPLTPGHTTYDVRGETYSRADLTVYPAYLETRTSPDGTRTATVISVRGCGMGGTCLFRVDVTEGDKVVFRSQNYEHPIHSLTFSPDGRRIAYSVGNTSHVDNSGNDAFVAVDGKRGITVDAVAYGSIRFSPNGKYVAYGAENQMAPWWIVEELIEDEGNMTSASLHDIAS